MFGYEIYFKSKAIAPRSIQLDTLHANDSNDNENVRVLLLEFLHIDKHSVDM
jgi:hypothetical protein